MTIKYKYIWFPFCNIRDYAYLLLFFAVEFSLFSFVAVELVEFLLPIFLCSEERSMFHYVRFAPDW